MRRSHHWRRLLITALTALLWVIGSTACTVQISFAPTPTPSPTPTRPLRPTFTPTPATTRAASQGTPSLASPTPTPTDTPAPPTPTPTPTVPGAIPSRNMNVRQGPGTVYPVIGAARAGQVYEITGKNPRGDWWQIDYNGRAGWLYAPLTETQGNVTQVQIAAHIPPLPTPTPTPVPTPTVPPPPQYEYNKAVVQRCDPNAGTTYVNGTVYRNHQPQNGVRVVYSHSPDGPWVTQPAITGPHPGYPDWGPGFYSHIIGANGPRGGDWYFWLVDDSGRRISAIAHLHTDSQAGPGKCQQAIIDFDTN